MAKVTIHVPAFDLEFDDIYASDEDEFYDSINTDDIVDKVINSAIITSAVWDVEE